jgi:DNA-binding response OmpR family regulator
LFVIIFFIEGRLLFYLKNKILLVDDERGIVTMMKNYFEMSGYQVYSAYNGKEAIEKVACQPDIILLDINMPEMDGISVCQRIREHITCPILFLTARIESRDKIIGFQAGADDYIVKPFDIDELGARVEAHLRREQRKQGQSIVRFFNELGIDYLKREVTVNGDLIQLSKKEFEIVELLSMNAGQVFDRERMYEAIWGIEGNGSSDTIMEHIRKIRSKLSEYTQHNYIDTVWGVGYKWNG